MGGMSAAEFAAARHLMGHTYESLAAALAVNPRTVRSWESGRDPVSPGAEQAIRAEVARHTNLTRRMVAAGTTVVIPKRPLSGPRGWFVAAAARAVEVDPDMIVEWDDG